MTNIAFQTLMWCMYAYPHIAVSNNQSERHIFFVCRASTQKSSLIATTFNLHDTLISHVGLGIIDENEMKVFHVEDKNGNALTVSSLDHFTQPGIFYYCVYAIPVTAEETTMLKNILQAYTIVKFDQELQLGNEALYCSEFCLKVLLAVNHKKFAFTPITLVVTDPFIQAFLGRKSLTYIPVDFFLSYPEVRKINEISLSLR